MVPKPSSTPRPRQAYVLDTNVLLYDPNALFVFHEHDVIIPITVIEEIDRFKKDLNETGRNARQVSRKLGSIQTGCGPARSTECRRGLSASGCCSLDSCAGLSASTTASRAGVG